MSYERRVFLPARTTGLILHAGILLILLAGVTIQLITAFTSNVGWRLIFFVLGAVILFAFIPFAAYRGYALLHATYTIEREGLRVRWGLRSEDLPLPEVTWVRPASDLTIPLKLPLFSVPGAILGYSEHPELGKVEFIASSVHDLVIVSSINKTLVLSPEEPVEFSNRFQRAIEMGSLSPIEPYTAKPAAYLSQVIESRSSRGLIFLSIGLVLLLLALTSILFPLRDFISLGYDANALPLEPVQSSRLLLLPVIGILFVFINLVSGLFFHRRLETRASSYFLWAAGSVTTLLLLLAVLLMVFRPG